MYNQAEETKRMLVYEVALAIYTVDYLNRHQHEWDTLEMHERMTDPAYIRGRFDAHQGIPRYQQLLDQAKVSINAVIEHAARLVEASAKPFPHPACKPVPVELGTGGITTGQFPFPLTPWTGEHADDCPYTIAARLRDLKSVL